MKNKSLLNSPSTSSNIPSLLKTYTTLLTKTTELCVEITGKEMREGSVMEKRHWETVSECVKSEICKPSNSTAVRISVLPVFGINPRGENGGEGGRTIGERFDRAVKYREGVLKEQKERRER